MRRDVVEIRRGIPYGFSHGAWAKPNPALHGWTKGVVPAIRFTDYALEGGGGLALLDRGLTGREIEGRTPVIFLNNAEDEYRGFDASWLSGRGRQLACYAIVPHDEPWATARIAQMAWEYNREPISIPARTAAPAKGFLETSPNVIAEAIRREKNHIEIRLVECLGVEGTVEVRLTPSRFVPSKSSRFSSRPRRRCPGRNRSLRGTASSRRRNCRPCTPTIRP
jgi:hypothetical protein